MTDNITKASILNALEIIDKHPELRTGRESKENYGKNWRTFKVVIFKIPPLKINYLT